MHAIRYIFGRKLMLYSFVGTDKPERITINAILPDDKWDNAKVGIIDWKINGDTVKITVATRPQDAYSPIGDWKLPIEKIVEEINPPGKRNWEWNKCLGQWRNTKTGAVRSF